jgi:peptidoglycan hydrolase CwlO-like protein
MKSQKALERALKALESDRDKLDAERGKLEDQIAHLRGMLGRRGGRRRTMRKKVGRMRKPMSAAQKKALSDAMKRRWAERKKAAKK